MGILKKNIIKNGVSSSLATAARACEQLVLIPFYISAWGAAEYGEWLTITAIPTMLAFADFGFGTSISNSFVLAYVSGEKGKAISIAKTGFHIVGLVIALCLVLSIAIVITLKHIGTFQNLLFEENDIIIALSCLLASKIIGFMRVYVQGFYRALRIAAVEININTSYLIINILITIIVLINNGNIIVLSIALLITSVLFNIGNTLYSLQKLNIHNWKNYKILPRKEIINLSQKGISYLAAPISQSLYHQGIILLIRLNIGAYGVTIFSTLKTLSRISNQITSIIKRSIYPEMQYEIGQGHYFKVQKIYRYSMYISILISLVSSFVLLLFGNRIYHLWINESIIIQTELWYIFIMTVIANSIWWTSCVVFSASNKPQIFAIGDITSSIISIISSYYFGQKFGIYGYACGLLLYEIMMVFWVIPNSRKIIHL